MVRGWKFKYAMAMVVGGGSGELEGGGLVGLSLVSWVLVTPYGHR